MSLRDAAEAGGWKDTTTLVKCHQPDSETLAEVVLAGKPFMVATSEA
jgi:hypothetical protein